MADVLLTCAETPLAWPPSVALTDVTISSTSTLNLHAPMEGSLQILTRRQGGGAGDGVSIEESPTVGADYRGQRYSLEGVVFHTPGLHVLPGANDVSPAEVHIHLRTFSAPQRAITIVVPASHKIREGGPSMAYFAAMNSKPDPSAERPTLEALLVPGVDMLIYRGPDIRGRTADDLTPAAQCAPDALQREFLVVLNTVFIRATDLERIPREGSLSTNPKDLPAPGVRPTKAVPRDRLLRCVTLARPGIAAIYGRRPPPPPEPATKELECRPLKVVNGRDVIDVNGKRVDLAKLLGFEKGGVGTGGTTQPSAGPPSWVQAVLMFIGTMIGLLLADWVVAHIWSLCFDPSFGHLYKWEPLKLLIFVSVAMLAAGFSNTPVSYLQGALGSNAPTTAPAPATDASGNLLDASGNSVDASGNPVDLSSF